MDQPLVDALQMPGRTGKLLTTGDESPNNFREQSDLVGRAVVVARRVSC